MTRKRYPSEISTKTVRLNIGDWQVLNEISRSHNITFAEAFHQLMTEISKREPAAVTSRAQIRMPLIEAFTVRSGIHRPMSLTTAIATNGSKGAAFRIKPKGARYD